MRIVSLCPSLTELVFDLGRGDDLVGITEYCVHPADGVAAVEKVEWAELRAKAMAKLEEIKDSDAVKPVIEELSEKVASNMEAINEALEPLAQKKEVFLEENKETIEELRAKTVKLYDAGREKTAELVSAAKEKLDDLKEK